MSALVNTFKSLGIELWVNQVITSPIVPEAGKALLLRWYGMNVDRGARVQNRVVFGGADITIGVHTYINHGVMIDAPCTIGSNCAIAPGAKIMTYSHELGGPSRRAGASTVHRVNIGDGVWIGAGAIILPGVTIGPGCVIGAGAVVTKDCEADGLYLGVPARRVKELPA
jgi:maltose O-acetyltransferase